MSAGAVFITLVCAMFPALILVAVVVKLREIRQAKHWPETTGKVIASRIQSRRNKPNDPGYNFGDTEVTNEPFVEYEYDVGGRKYRCSRVSIAEKTAGTEREAILARYPVGARVTVFYNPAEPATAVVERELPKGVMIVGGGAVLLFFVGGPLITAGLYFNALGWLGSHVENPDRAPLVAAAAGMGLAASLFTLVFTQAVRRACAWPITRGRITAAGVEAFRARPDFDDTHRRPRVRFKPRVTYSYEVKGRQYIGDRLTMGVTVAASFPGLAGRITARYPVGSEVDVHYNPLDPGESVLRPRSVLHHLLWLVAAALFAFAWALATGRIR
ncbi:DUF3592 domain-containing protein [Tundrisphaera lichenicola]|uniref:DUF3592 domain-containing protein n=1 Tax=Tundrisphaera lichenicola TaxID=2029860 RepID=UPI003EBE2968